MNHKIVISCCVLCMTLHAPVARSVEPISKEQAKAIKRMEMLDRHRRLKPGDAVSIQVVEDKREALIQIVAVTGEIQCPYTGLISVAGLTCRDLAFRCKASLEKNFFKTATVIVFVTQSLPVWHSSDCHFPEFVVAYGKVLKPGKYEFPYDKGLTVTRFLKLAGGYTSQGQLPKIQIVRHTPQGNKRILVHTRAILIERRSDYDIFLRAQDVVIVE
jgi:polysaccharide export outer membrane protein